MAVAPVAERLPGRVAVQVGSFRGQRNAARLAASPRDGLETFLNVRDARAERATR